MKNKLVLVALVSFVLLATGFGANCGELIGGYIDRTGKFVIQPQYNPAGEFSEGIALVRDANSKYTGIEKIGNVVLRPTFTCYEVFPFSDGLAAVRTGVNKYGYMDKTGNLALQPKYELALKFSDGLAAVNLDGAWKLIDTTGKIVVDIKVDWLYSPTEGLSLVHINKKCGFVDKTGKVIIKPQFEAAVPFSDGLARVEVKGRWGYIDKSGKMVIAPKWVWADDFSEGLACVAEDKVTDDKSAKSSPSNASVGAPRPGGKLGYIDKTGKIVIPFKFETAHPFSEGLAAVAIGEKFDYIEGQAVRSIGAKPGYIDKTGKLVIEPKCVACFEFRDGLAVAYVEKPKESK